MFFRSVLRWIHKYTLVFDGTSPLAWQNLDVSAVVGKRHALVFIKLHNTSGGSDAYYFRSGDETNDVAFDANRPGGMNIIFVKWGNIACVVQETNADGVLQWKAGVADISKIYVRGYI